MAERRWHVSWEVHFDEDDEDLVHAGDAARKALDYITRPGSIAHVFQVTYPDGRTTAVVDLDEDS